MILGEDPKHVFQFDTNLSLSLSLCLSPSLRLSLSLVLDLAWILVSALVLVLVLVLALGLARLPEAASGSHLEANIGNRSFSLQKLAFSQNRWKAYSLLHFSLKSSDLAWSLHLKWSLYEVFLTVVFQKARFFFQPGDATEPRGTARTTSSSLSISKSEP